MITTIEAVGYVAQLAALRRMPKGEAALKAVAGILAKLASDSEHAERIIGAILLQHSEWPGPAVLREAAEATSEAAQRDRSSAESLEAKWKREFDDRTRGGICLTCNGLGIVMQASGQVVRCTCPEGRPHWIDRDGRPAFADAPGAVLLNSDEWVARWNASVLRKGDAAAKAIGVKRAG